MSEPISQLNIPKVAMEMDEPEVSLGVFDPDKFDWNKWYDNLFSHLTENVGWTPLEASKWIYSGGVDMSGGAGGDSSLNPYDPVGQMKAGKKKIVVACSFNGYSFTYPEDYFSK